jgi:hypothetical protein
LQLQVIFGSELQRDFSMVVTEVLSEGVNLHRSNIVINYDIPWNPTRLGT